MENELLRYYENELVALRHLSQEFASRYPKIAGRLLIESGGKSADPHVERLMEGVAFLTARVQKKLDDAFPEITNAFFEILYPHYLKPIPSCSIIQFDVDTPDLPVTSKHFVPRNSRVLSPPLAGLQCKFNTCYDVDVWPIKIKNARIDPIGHSVFLHGTRKTSAILRIQLECVGGASFDQLPLNKLRFFIDGDKSTSYALYELLFNNLEHAIVTEHYSENSPAYKLPSSDIKPVGFSKEEALLDYDPRSFDGYRLLHEYFAFPDKFLFFDLGGLKKINMKNFGRNLEVIFFINEFERAERLSHLVQSVDDTTFKLYCTPIINLFKQRAEPIRLSHMKSEYRVIPERRWPMGMEVYSVQDVTRVRRLRGYDDTVLVPPLFGLKPDILNTQEQAQDVFWITRRRESLRENDQGSEVYVSVVDKSLSSASPTDDVLTLSLLCTNRDLPSSIPIGTTDGDFSLEGGEELGIIRALRKPTKSLRPKLEKEAYWRLISHLSLNHLSISHGGKDAITAILNLYNFSNSLAIKQELSGVMSIESEPAISMVGLPHRSSFCQGTKVTMKFDEEMFVGGGVFLFSAILNHFFALYSSANSFTQLNVQSKQREKDLVKWPPRLGKVPLL